MILALLDEAQHAGARLAPACRELNLDVRTVQRWRADGVGDDARMGPKSDPPNKLSVSERALVLATANRPEFRDLSPKQIVPTLADSGQYIASESTFYRLLREAKQLKHRGRAKAPTSTPPAEKRATGPGQVWSWDITYLRSSLAGRFFYLYMFVDVWSRKIVGHAVHEAECSQRAAKLLTNSLEAEGLSGVSVVLHSDNGAPMKGATLKATMEHLGVIASYSRPSVSDDNPYSESLFRTLKYRPDYPQKPFTDAATAAQWVDGFVQWYNHKHLHSAIGYVSPADRHAGRGDDILSARSAVYELAKRRHPHRWAGRSTRAWTAPQTVLLNPDKHTSQPATLRSAA